MITEEQLQQQRDAHQKQRATLEANLRVLNALTVDTTRRLHELNGALQLLDTLARQSKPTEAPPPAAPDPQT